MKMETERRREARRRKHVTQIGRYTVRALGPQAAVGRALGVQRSTVAHWLTDREFPALRDALNVLIRCNQYPGLDVDAYTQAMESAVDLGALVMVDHARIVADFHVLVCAVWRAAAAEREAFARRVGWNDALLSSSRVTARLARTNLELRARGIDPYALLTEAGR